MDWSKSHSLSLVAQTVKNLPAMQKTQETRFNPWVRKIPWRMAWQPTPVVFFFFLNWRIIALQNFVKPQHESAIGIYIPAPFWTPPSPFPSHLSRLIQSPCLSFLSHNSKFLLAIYFTIPSRKRSMSRLYIVTLLIQLICRVHLEKRWAGRSTS